MSRQVPRLSDQTDSILILHAGALGDFVLCTHLVHRLRGVYPGAEVAAAARTRIVHWFADHQVYDRAYDLESLALHRLFSPAGSPPASSPLHNYDVILSFVAGPDAAFSRNLTRSVNALVVAVDPTPSRETRKSPRHITEQWLSDLACATLPLPELDMSCGLAPRFGETIERAQTSKVICHPGAGGRAKCAPLEDFEKFVAGLRSREVDVAWMIGPTERDWYGQAYVERLAQSAPVIEEQDICAAADLLSHSTAFVGNDAGITHLAAAIGLHTVALFGPTDPIIWRPIGPHVALARFEDLNPLDERLLSHLTGGPTCH